MKAKRICALLLACALLGLGGLVPGPANAGHLAFTVDEPDWLPYYGEGATQQQAEKAAIRACGGSETCVKEVESAQTPICFAIADGPKWLGWSSRKTPEEAIDVAMKECMEKSSGCRIISVECRK